MTALALLIICIKKTQKSSASVRRRWKTHRPIVVIESATTPSIFSPSSHRRRWRRRRKNMHKNSK